MGPVPSCLMLLDSASLYFRAFYGVPQSVRAPDGTAVNAVRGFLDMVATLVVAHHPTHLVACWDDDWRPAFRVAAIPSYKAHRVARADTQGAEGGADPHRGQDGAEDVPDALTPQVSVIAEVLAALGIARVGHPGYEADDVIATLAERAAEQRATAVDVVTGDRDLFQLVDDTRRIRVLYTARGGVRQLDVVDEARLRERYGVTGGRQYAALAALRGDPSDGLPGVPGIGEKTAAALVRRAGDLPGLLRALDADDSAVTGAQRARLLAARDYLQVAPSVVDVVRDVPLPSTPAALPIEPIDPARLDELVLRWGLGGSVTRVRNALAERERDAPG
ncbi:MAG: 5'-3' exonuclease [Angustibacter sp.]